MKKNIHQEAARKLARRALFMSVGERNTELILNDPVDRDPRKWSRRAATLLRGMKEQLERQMKGQKL
jgi:hypothetical protein